eukprot:9355947-Prorocentrum_lima.AAC.1
MSSSCALDLVSDSLQSGNDIPLFDVLHVHAAHVPEETNRHGEAVYFQISTHMIQCNPRGRQ